MTLRRCLLMMVLAVALGASACGASSSTAAVARGLEPRPDGWRGVPIEAELTMPDVALFDTTGARVVLSERTTGTPTLLFFGYTRCPDICPVHMAAIAAAMRDSGLTAADIDVVFVSVDPGNDTPERIDEWLAHFDRSFLGLHGPSEAVEAALTDLDLPGPIVEGPDPRGEGELLGHPAQVIGFDANGRARRAWPFGTRRADWINDLPLIVERWS